MGGIIDEEGRSLPARSAFVSDRRRMCAASHAIAVEYMTTVLLSNVDDTGDSR